MDIHATICAYLDANEAYLNISGIAYGVGCNPGNFARYRTVKRFPEKYIVSLQKVLIGLNYSGRLNETITDNNKAENKQRIEQERHTIADIGKAVEQPLQAKEAVPAAKAINGNDEPAEGTRKFFLKYGAYTWEAVKVKKDRGGKGGC